METNIEQALELLKNYVCCCDDNCRIGDVHIQNNEMVVTLYLKPKPMIYLDFIVYEDGSIKYGK